MTIVTSAGLDEPEVDRQLDTELKLFDRVVYKHRNSQRNSLPFRRLTIARRCVRRLVNARCDAGRTDLTVDGCQNLGDMHVMTDGRLCEAFELHMGMLAQKIFVPYALTMCAILGRVRVILLHYLARLRDWCSHGRLGDASNRPLQLRALLSDSTDARRVNIALPRAVVTDDHVEEEPAVEPQERRSLTATAGAQNTKHSGVSREGDVCSHVGKAAEHVSNDLASAFDSSPIDHGRALVADATISDVDGTASGAQSQASRESDRGKKSNSRHQEGDVGDTPASHQRSGDAHIPSPSAPLSRPQHQALPDLEFFEDAAKVVAKSRVRTKNSKSKTKGKASAGGRPVASVAGTQGGSKRPNKGGNDERPAATHRDQDVAKKKRQRKEEGATRARSEPVGPAVVGPRSGVSVPSGDVSTVDSQGEKKGKKVKRKEKMQSVKDTGSYGGNKGAGVTMGKMNKKKKPRSLGSDGPRVPKEVRAKAKKKKGREGEINRKAKEKQLMKDTIADIFGALG